MEGQQAGASSLSQVGPGLKLRSVGLAVRASTTESPQRPQLQMFLLWEIVQNFTKLPSEFNGESLHYKVTKYTVQMQRGHIEHC